MWFIRRPRHYYDLMKRLAITAHQFYLLALVSLIAACNRPDPDHPDLVAISPPDGAVLNSDEVVFRWRTDVPGGVKFRLYADGDTLVDIDTQHKELREASAGRWGKQYEWEISQGQVSLRQSYEVRHILAAYQGTYAGTTTYSDQSNGSLSTFPDAISISVVDDLVVSSLAQASFTRSAPAIWLNMDSSWVRVNWHALYAHGDLTIDLRDTSITAQHERQVNSRGDMERIYFHTN